MGFPGCPSGLCQRVDCLRFDSNDNNGVVLYSLTHSDRKVQKRTRAPPPPPRCSKLVFSSIPKKRQSLMEEHPDREMVLLSPDLVVIISFLSRLGDRERVPWEPRNIAQDPKNIAADAYVGERFFWEF